MFRPVSFGTFSWKAAFGEGTSPTNLQKKEWSCIPRKDSCPSPVRVVWNRLLETLKTLNVPLFATVDHAANARTAGLFMPETRVAFFGKPAVGTHLMLERPEVALELPLRIVISEVPGEGTMLFMPDILWLAHRYGIDPQLDSLRKTLGFMALVSDKVCGD